ncbi:MAG: acetylornithine/succinylornithine family transaminase, partial [Clostridia bacterium]|nr:acetylornithine/succinylornithine family transaminase [Clostridia bacterium]
MNVFEKDSAYIAGTYARFPLALTHGRGALVYDTEGREYIDLSSGIAVNTFGYSDPVWAQAVAEQAGKLQHTSNLFYSAPCARLAEMLCTRTGMKKVFFSNSGAEANECAIKCARKYAADRYGSDRCQIITLKNSFHGRTVTTLSATGQDSFHELFHPLTEGFRYARPSHMDDIVGLTEDGKVAAIMIELVQGEGGVYPLERDYVTALAAYAQEKDILLIVDEVQTGNGRTGALYAYMNYGITPDIVTTAKGLAGGLPLGATLFGEKTEGVLTPGTHGSTFGGNPVACAGAISILDRLDAVLLEQVKEKSIYIREELTDAPGILSVSGMGLMLGIETVADAGAVIAACREKGVLVIRAKNKVRLLPPLNIEVGLLKRAVAVIREVCKDLG